MLSNQRKKRGETRSGIGGAVEAELPSVRRHGDGHEHQERQARAYKLDDAGDRAALGERAHRQA